jgi:hypothetical protein
MFTCPFCNASFQYEDRLKVHIVQKHLNLPTNMVQDSDVKEKPKEEVKEKVPENKDVKDKVLEIKPPPTIKPKRFKIARRSMKDTILITWKGEFYFKFILSNATPEMKDEISEGIANWIYNYLKNNKDVQFRVVKQD